MSDFNRGLKSYLDDNLSPAELASVFMNLPMNSRNFPPGLISSFPAKSGLGGYMPKIVPFGNAPGSYMSSSGMGMDESVRHRASQPVVGPGYEQRGFANFPFSSMPPPSQMNHLQVNNDAMAAMRSRTTSGGNGVGSPNSIWSSNLDPNSKPFSPKPSAKTFDPNLDTDIETHQEKDANSNIIRNAINEMQNSEMHQKMRKIWDGGQSARVVGSQGRTAPLSIGKTDEPRSSNAFLAMSNFPPLISGSGSEDGKKYVGGLDSDEENALKSKYCSSQLKQRTFSRSEDLDENGNVDQFGLRSMLRHVRPRCEDIAAEATFVEQVISHTQGRPLLDQLDGPFSNQVFTPLHDSVDVPEEYSKITSTLLKSLGGPDHMMNWPTDLLFFFFYTATGDLLQLMAGNILHCRGWRYIKTRGIWVARKKHVQPLRKNEQEEFGEYQYFDVKTWKRSVDFFNLKYNELAERIAIPLNECKLQPDQLLSMMMKQRDPTQRPQPDQAQSMKQYSADVLGMRSMAFKRDQATISPPHYYMG